MRPEVLNSLEKVATSSGNFTLIRGQQWTVLCWLVTLEASSLGSFLMLQIHLKASH
jgi:hypothetical protein